MYNTKYTYIIQNIYRTSYINITRFTMNLKPNSFIVSINEGWRGEVVHCVLVPLFVWWWTALKTHRDPALESHVNHFTFVICLLYNNCIKY